MADLRHHLSQSRQPLRLDNLGVQGLGFGELPDNAGEIKGVADRGHGKGDGGGKCLAVFAHGLKLGLVADQFRLFRLHILVNRPLMALPAGRSQNQGQVPADHILPAVAEHPFRRLVEKDDRGVLVNGHKGLVGVFHRTLQDADFPVTLFVFRIFLHGINSSLSSIMTRLQRQTIRRQVNRHPQPSACRFPRLPLQPPRPGTADAAWSLPRLCF